MYSKSTTMNNQSFDEELERELAKDSDVESKDPQIQQRNTLQTQEMVGIEQVASELMHSSFEQLSQKYSLKEISDLVATNRPVSNTNVIDYILLFRQLFIIDFCPIDQIKNLTNQDKEKIILSISFLKSTDAPQLADQLLKQINPNLILPANFSINDYQPRALEIYNASFNIKNIMAEFLMFDFLPDTNHFIKLSSEQLKALSQEVTSLSQKMEIEYKKLLQNQPIDEKNFEEMLKFLAKVGRTPFYIKEMQEKKNLGELTDIILKINTALQVANILKATNPTGQFSKDQIKLAIKTFIMQDMVL